MIEFDQKGTSLRFPMFVALLVFNISRTPYAPSHRYESSPSYTLSSTVITKDFCPMCSQTPRYVKNSWNEPNHVITRGPAEAGEPYLNTCSFWLQNQQHSSSWKQNRNRLERFPWFFWGAGCSLGLCPGRAPFSLLGSMKLEPASYIQSVERFPCVFRKSVKAWRKSPWLEHIKNAVGRHSCRWKPSWYSEKISFCLHKTFIFWLWVKSMDPQNAQCRISILYIHIPRCSMYGLFTYIWVVLGVFM